MNRFRAWTSSLLLSLPLTCGPQVIQNISSHFNTNSLDDQELFTEWQKGKVRIQQMPFVSLLNV
jgi:hypothetical protein